MTTARRFSSLVVGTALLSVAADTRPLIAQAPTSTMSSAAPNTQQRRAPGRVLARTSAFGALSGTMLAMGYYFMSERGERSSGCQPLNCALPFLSVSGALAGLFIGRELDAQRKAFAPRVGESMAFSIVEGGVLSAPTYIDVRDSLIAVVSDSGAQLLTASNAPKALRRRANGLSSMRQVALMPSRGTLVVGTASALWEANLVTGPASRMFDGPVDALAVSREAVLSASGRMLRLRTGTGDQARTDSTEMNALVSAVAYDSVGGAWWVATDSQMVRFNSENGKLVRSAVSVAIPVAARSIAVSADWIAAALGDEGIIAWRRESIGTPSAAAPARVVQEPRFAYDLAFLGEALFVAGGVDGLFQISLSPVPRVVGSSRQMQFATTVRAGNGVVWVGDRSRQSVVRVTP